MLFPVNLFSMKRNLSNFTTGIILVLLLAACTPFHRHTPDGAPRGHIDVSKIPNAVPKAEPLSKYGNPSTYYMQGKRLQVLKSAKGYNKVGFASWYGTRFNGQLTSTREPYSLYAMTAASKDLPLPTYVEVTNLENGRRIIVKVNDRGPFVANRIIDLSYVAALKLGYANRGTTLVRVTAIDPYLWVQNKSIPKTAPLPTNFYVQVGAFRNFVNAEQYKQRIIALTNAPVNVKTGYHNNVPIYRVQVGPLVALESDQLREKLEAQGLASGINVIS